MGACCTRTIDAKQPIADPNYEIEPQVKFQANTPDAMPQVPVANEVQINTPDAKLQVNAEAESVAMPQIQVESKPEVNTLDAKPQVNAKAKPDAMPKTQVENTPEVNTSDVEPQVKDKAELGGDKTNLNTDTNSCQISEEDDYCAL